MNSKRRILSDAATRTVDDCGKSTLPNSLSSLRTVDKWEALTSARARALSPCAVSIDSLYVGYFIDGIGIDWEALRYEKEKLRAEPSLSHAELRFGGEQFALHRGAPRPYSFMLSNKAFTLKLGERIEPRCHAQFSSHTLWTAGLLPTLNRFDSIWSSIGSRYTRLETISRVDAAFDFAIGKPDFCLEDFVSQADKDSTWRENQKAQTFQFGRSEVVCRIYDKIAEIEQQSGKDWLFDVWGTRDGVWRAEFQIRGERLKQSGIKSLEQLRAHLPKLVRDIAQKHTSLRTPSTDSNRSRWPLHPMWAAILETADQLVTPPEHAPPPLLAGTEYQLDRQLQSLFGHLKGIAATLSVRRPEDVVGLEELFRRLPALVKRFHAPELWKADVVEKVRKRELGL